MDGNAFTTSLQQLGQWLSQQNQGTGSGQPLMGPTNGGGYSNQQPSKVVTQVHYDQTPPPTQTSQDLGTPAVATAPPAPQVSSFAPPQGSAQAIPHPGAFDAPSSISQGSGGQGGSGGAGASGGAGGMGSMGGMNKYSSAISGVSSALAKGFSDASKDIGGVNTMPNPVQSGPFPGIEQYTPVLFGRR